MKNVNTYTLSDNTVIVVSPMKNSRTGYLGSSFFEVWRPETPFVASHGNNDEMKVLLDGIVPNINTTVHLFGEFNDSREAAYVAAKFREDPITTMFNFLNNGKIVDFPTDLYDLPVFMSLSEAQDRMMKVKEGKKNRVVKVTLKKEVLKVKTDFPNHSLNSPVNKGLFTKMTKSYDINGLYTKFGAKMVTDARNLTAQEFVDLFGL